MRYVALVVLFVAGMLIGVACFSSGPAPSPEELVRRCAASQPAWNGYQEDIKEIGAGPVARWQGRPLALSVVGKTIRLTMALESPWADWEAALPLLLKTPEGQVFRNAGYEHQPEGCVYLFETTTDHTTILPPWVDIQYPHTRKRLHLDGVGHWRAPEASVDRP